MSDDCPRCTTLHREYVEFQEQSAELEAELERELKTAQDNLAAAKTKLEKVRQRDEHRDTRGAEGRGEVPSGGGERQAPDPPRRCARWTARVLTSLSAFCLALSPASAVRA